MNFLTASIPVGVGAALIFEAIQNLSEFISGGYLYFVLDWPTICAGVFDYLLI